MKTKIKIDKNKKVNHELDAMKDQLARALADYDNLRKRVEKERVEFEQRANEKLTIKLLPVFDMLTSAQKHVADPGIAITLVEFRKVLEAEGIEEIAAEEGVKFDEQMHDAVDAVEDKAKRGTIAEKVLSGWKFEDGTVIRPAKVRVYN